MSEKKEYKFDFDSVFNPEDYMYFYGDELNDERTNREVAFLVDEMEMNKPMSVLDVACGFGRHSIKLAELGHHVTGIDYMEGFLSLARKQAEEKGLKINFIKKDMRQVEFNEEFDRALLLFTAFGYFSDEENLEVLKKISKALVQGGLFCFDTFNRDAFLKDFKQYFVHEIRQDLMIDRNTFDPKTGRLIDERIIIRDGKRKDVPFSLRLYDYNEIEKMIEQGGMKIDKVYGDWKKSPFTMNSKGMKIIAKKL
ncbi:MAG: class I SAM-dependent methyltransferase [Candidatus Cloacimonetes bacterium]|nr:class I SAM-dependent methyltransferase [Candidatus Cloacimonadota bacterium]